MPRPRNTATNRADENLLPINIRLSGKYRTDVDASQITFRGENDAIIYDFSDMENLRYTDDGVIGIQGMSKINTTSTTNKLFRNVHHFTKSQPAESHIVVQAYDATETSSVVYKNDTAIPNAGDFNGTAIHTDESGASRGRFENGPLGRLLYCNGKETMVWGGDESRISSFMIYNPDGSFLYDYTEKVQNTLTDASNVASFFQTPAGIDANVMLLLHCDGTDGSTTFDDESTTDHTVTPVGNAQIDTADKKFGTASGLFDGTGDYLTIADHADFDLSGGTWTIEMWIKPNSLSGSMGLYSQGNSGVDTDYSLFYVRSDGSLEFVVVAASANVVTLTTAAGVVATGGWYHVAVVSTPGSSDTDYRIFVNGAQKAFVNDADKPANYTAVVAIGARHRGSTIDFNYNGWIDEVRVSDSARWTNDFEAPVNAYGTDVTVFARVGNILPISAINWDVATANTTAGTASVASWDGSGWSAVSNFSDGTASGGVPLAQSGSMTFDTTETTAKQRVIDGTLGYWYRVSIPSADTTTRISNVTVTEPFQPLRDLWDHVLRFSSSVQLYEATNSVYYDFTFNVFDNAYISTDPASFMTMDSLDTTEHLVLGFLERMQGLNVQMIPESVNTNAAAVEIEYWSGSAWTSVGTITDGTNQTGSSFGSSGYITWNPLEENVEFRREFNKSDSFYFYRLSWSAQLSTTVEAFYIAGIPVQRQLGNFSFALHAQNRTMLFSDQSDKKNAMLPSAFGTLNSFNGSDSGDYVVFGDDTEVTGAVEIFTKLTTGIVSDILVAKTNSMYVLTGSSPDTWKRTQISNDIGCPAPLTFKSSPIGLEHAPLSNRHVAIWQAHNGIMMYDSNSIFPISDSIRDIFDRNNSNSINLSKIGDSIGFWDNSNGNYEYHWLYASGSSTTLDKELVFDLRRQKWWPANRGSGNALQCGTSVRDTNGAFYSYGCKDTGFLLRLENGTSFDGTAIQYVLELGDVIFSRNPMFASTVRYLRMLMKAKEITSNSITVTHYADTKTTGVDITMSMSKSGYRLANPGISVGGYKWPKAIFHRLRFVVSTDDESIGFEPLLISGFYQNEGMVTD